jgi:cytidyltransferase-like protein
MDLSDQGEKDLLKSIYLLQLRKSFLTRAELMQKTGLDAGKSDDILREFTRNGILEREDNDNYALQDKGRSKLRVVLVGGVYDILHLGHLAALAEAKTHGDLLVVVVATDTTVEILKGRRPVFPEEDRRTLVEALKPVDAAILGYEDVGMGYEQVIAEVKPDIIALGYDQDSVARTVTELVEKRRLKVRIVRLTKFDREMYLSSSAIRQTFFRETNW